MNKLYSADQCTSAWHVLMSNVIICSPMDNVSALESEAQAQVDRYRTTNKQAIVVLALIYTSLAIH